MAMVLLTDVAAIGAPSRATDVRRGKSGLPSANGAIMPIIGIPFACSTQAWYVQARDFDMLQARLGAGLSRCLAYVSSGNR